MSLSNQNNLSEDVVTDQDENLGRDQMDLLYSETLRNFEEGAVVDGTVIAIYPTEVVVDIGYKSEGHIAKSEFSEEEASNLKVGDRISVYLEEREDAQGNLVLSKEKADRMKVWDSLEELSEKGEVLEGKVVSRIKGGMTVDIGLKAFLPGSQIDLRPVRDMDRLVGQTIQVRIIKMNKKRGNIIVSRRVLLEEWRDRRKKLTMESLKEGEVLEGIVKNITDYGAFIDLGGVDGLLHITDMSWGRVSSPQNLMAVGDKINVMVLKHDKETGRVSLGLKQLKSDPWTTVAERYPEGSKVTAKVVSITDYGAFLEIEPGVEGLMHITEMSWNHEVKHPSKIMNVGDMVEAKVLKIDEKNRKISLGLKQLGPNPWDVVEDKYPIGTIVSGKVKSLTDFGVFVGLEEGIDGLIHISDLSWTRHVRHPSEVFKKGQKVDAIVLKIEKERQRLSLGYKQMTADPWESEIPERFPVGRVMKGKVTKVMDFGFFVEIEDGVEGLVHVSEVDLPAGERLDQMFPVDTEVNVRVVKIDKAERKIGLSVKGLEEETA
ncbi:MAG: 30S ribosomal protein S1 [Nitrospirae bacterium]|nr:30S ribosomal protein S1 [Nitrospirota bacterium]MCL5285609.1 30S ribosomal protein S1 [Nitrospirota bacterium]